MSKKKEIQETEKKEQEKCMICFETKPTARLPCTCVANVCRDCWTTQRENSTNCIVCRKQLPVFFSWHFSKDSVTMPATMLLLIGFVGLFIFYLTTTTQHMFGTWYLIFNGAVGTLTIVQDTLIPKVVNSFFNGDSGLAVITGCTLALLHLYVFFVGFAEISWYVLCWLPGMTVVSFVVACLLLNTLGALIIAAGMQVDAVRDSDFK